MGLTWCSQTLHLESKQWHTPLIPLSHRYQVTFHAAAEDSGEDEEDSEDSPIKLRARCV